MSGTAGERVSLQAEAAAADRRGAAAAPDGGDASNAGTAAGRALWYLSVLPALLVTAWLLVGLPLLFAGLFTPVLTLALAGPLAVVLAVLGLRRIPGRPGRATRTRPVRRPALPATPWWAVAAVVAIAGAFGAEQLIFHSQFIIVTRDPASYLQFAAWISRHGALPIPEDAAAFGGTRPGLTFGSPAFYQVGSAIVPQFMAGLPMVLAAGFWVGGAGTAVLLAPVLGACAILTAGGLAARLVGPRWAPLAALVLALSLPEQFTSRSTYSEPLTQILLLGGLCLVVDSLAGDEPGARVRAALGGLALGLTFLVRLDGASDILPVIPYCGMLLIGRRRQAVPLTAGFFAGLAYGAVDGLFLTRPYLEANRSSVLPLALLVMIAIAVTAIAVVVLPGTGLPASVGRWLPAAAALLAPVIMIGFALRPYLDPVHGKPDGALRLYQAADHLTAAPAGRYFELSLNWVFWYIGVPAVVLGTAGAVLLARRCRGGGAPGWTLPLMLFSWVIVTTLYRPAITPDQPWASRRLVPAVLPGFILLAVWAVRWLADRFRQRGVRPLTVAVVVACCATALAGPASITTLGLRMEHRGPLGISLTADGLAFKRTYGGEIGAVEGLCRAIPADSSVVFVTGGGSSEYSARRLTEVVRGMCGDPVADVGEGQPRAVELTVAGIERAGRRPVLLASYPSLLLRYGGRTREIIRLRTTQDEHALTRPPLKVLPFVLNLWMSRPLR